MVQMVYSRKNRMHYSLCLFNRKLVTRSRGSGGTVIHVCPTLSRNVATGQTAQYFVRFLSTDTTLLPKQVQQVMHKLQQDTRHCTGLVMNVCLSYGSRDEIVQTCRHLAIDCVNGKNTCQSYYRIYLCQSPFDKQQQS
mmetsp:Transcript_10515/g.13934  ORF Transcript_10515/g.13934 Transcript_10515/m.13934 type:complete len:138 (+) Transcript_10515:267-680(+)